MRDQRIEELQLTSRTCNLLHRQGIHTIQDLLSTPLDDIGKAKGVGERTFEEIKKATKEFRTQSTDFAKAKNQEYYQQLSTVIHNIYSISGDTLYQ